MNKEKLEPLRLPEERELRQSLSDNLNVPLLRQIISKIPPKLSDKEFYYNLKAHSVLAKNGLIPHLEEVFAEIKTKLGLTDKQIDLYVSSDNPFNCRCYGGNSNFFPPIICIGNELVERLNKPGLAYVIGHELGHLILEHVEFREATSLLYSSIDRQPPNIRNQHNILDKFEEISADRIGFLVSGDLESSVKTMVILVSGLNDELLKLTLSQIFDYCSMILKDLKKLKVFPDSKHPAMPLRIMALKAFAESELYKSALTGEPVENDPSLEAKMAELTNLIKVYPTDPQEYWIMMSKAAAIYLIITADKEITYEEKAGLLDIISSFCWCPDAVLKEILEKGPQTFLEVGINYFKLNNPSKIDEIVGEVARFIVRDRRIDTSEYEEYMEITQKYLGFDEMKALMALAAAVSVLKKHEIL